MFRIKLINYTMLEFSHLENSNFKYCLGVIGFLFINRETKWHTSWIPSKFINSLSSHCKNDLIKYLIIHQYIILHKIKKDENELWYMKFGIKRKIYDENFKKEANIYLLTNKLRTLRQVKLLDEPLTIFIDKHLHLLNDQYFNHYEHSYKHIKIDGIFREDWNLLTSEERDLVPKWGQPEIKNYDISDFGFDNNKFAGTHINIFMSHEFLIPYTSLVLPIEIGIFNSEAILLADQLLKTTGKNDFSKFFLKSKFKKPIYDKDGKLISQYRQPLFYNILDYDVSHLIFKQQLMSALYGWEYIKEFKEEFPNAYNLLYNIKRGGNNKIQPYYGFTSNLKMPIYKNDIRLQLEENHPAIKRGQLYYKIIALVIMIREVEIMREIWRRLKKCDIVFIPLQSSVVVSKLVEEQTKYIVDDVLKNHIDKSLKYIVFVKNSF